MLHSAPRREGFSPGTPVSLTFEKLIFQIPNKIGDTIAVGFLVTCAHVVLQQIGKRALFIFCLLQRSLF